MSVFSELKRRNVFRVAAAYLVAGWLLIEVSETLEATLHLPEWADTLLAYFIILGFPIVLFFAWAYEITPEGIKREKDIAPGDYSRAQTARRLDWAVIILFVLAASFFAVDRFVLDEDETPPFTEPELVEHKSSTADGAATESTTSAAPPRLSIAVLPFINMSPDPEQEYFSDGLTEELLNLLAGVGQLKVAARTSSFYYKDKLDEIPLTEIARQLEVAHVLEGSVRKSGNRIRITAQLIKVDDGFHLWSNTWDRTLDDIFTIQDDIAEQVARALEVTLLGEPPSRPQASPEVYSLYLRARHFDNLKGEENWSRAVDYYRQALVLDPAYAPAWAGLARTYRYQASMEPAEFFDGMALARGAAQRAIELDDTSAAAWANLAQIEMTEQWDWAAAESALDNAMRHGPGNAEVLHAAGELALIRGRLDKALDYFRDALARDPLSLTANNTLGTAYMNAREYENAKSTFAQLLELSPNYPWGHVNMGRVLLLENRPGEALAHFELAEPGPWRDFGHVLALDALGRQVEADAAMTRLERDFSHSGAFLIATVHAWRSQHDQAFAWLERSFERHESGLVYMVRDPVMERLHDDPRWAAFLERMGLAVRS